MYVENNKNNRHYKLLQVLKNVDKKKCFSVHFY